MATLKHCGKCMSKNTHKETIPFVQIENTWNKLCKHLVEMAVYVKLRALCTSIFEVSIGLMQLVFFLRNAAGEFVYVVLEFLCDPRP